MENLTKEQKLQVVKYAYERWKGNYSKFMCINLKYGLVKLLGLIIWDTKDVPLYIPELLNYKPKHPAGASAWWFTGEEGMEARDKAFQGLIKELSSNEGIWNKIVKFFKNLF